VTLAAETTSMAREQSGFIVSYRTPHYFVAQMLTEQFKENGIPSFIQRELCSGLRLAIHWSAWPGPGLEYLVLAPKELSEQARTVTETFVDLGENEPGPWAFTKNKKLIKIWKGLLWALLLYYIVIFAWVIINSAVKAITVAG